MAYVENRCDLLKNYYLCRENNNDRAADHYSYIVVICLKTTIFAERTTTRIAGTSKSSQL